MRKLLYILTGLALLAACNSEDKTIVTPATLSVKVNTVGASKVNFSITCSSPDAAYIYIGIGAFEDWWFSWTDMQVAQEYLKQIRYMDDEYSKDKKFSNFQDRFCFKGDRSFRYQFLGRDMDYRLIVFQVDPFKREIVGEPASTTFHTEVMPHVDLDFQVDVQGDVLTITPSDPDITYYWDYESKDYFWGEQENSVYYYLYSVTDMYEKYGFIDQVISKGPETYAFSQNDKGMVEGETIILAAVPYVNHEMANDPRIWEFEYHKNPGKSTLRAVDVPAGTVPVPLRPWQWTEHHSRKNR